MEFTLHPDYTVQQLAIGDERQPLLVIDNFIGNPDALVELAAAKVYGDAATYYPGIRAKAPLGYQQLILDKLRALAGRFFGLEPGTIRFTDCHYSIVTTPGERLTYLQRIPHVDSTVMNELAMVHYLFKANFGGTAFYRHRRTGFEYVNMERREQYLACLEQDQYDRHSPGPAYICESTPLYEQISAQQGVFNRLLMYRRSSLHSGSIAPGFVPDPNPRTGRLSMNGFLTGTPAIQNPAVPNQR